MLDTRIALAAALTLSLPLAGCGQGYSPQPARHVATPQGGGGVFNGADLPASYQPQSYLQLRSTLTDVLLVAPAVPAQSDNPLADPIGFLDANQTLLGAPVYAGDATSSHGDTAIVAGGFKAWVLAASSACGLAMEAQPSRLFPNGPHDPALAYGLLLGRAPTEPEINALEQLYAATDPSTGAPLFASDVDRDAAACTTLLVSIEFLGE